MEKPKKTPTPCKYGANFKAQIFKMVANGQLVSQIAQHLQISEALIYRWKKTNPHPLPALLPTCFLKMNVSKYGSKKVRWKKKF
ncbi:MAG: helix-turn-helix domain-containing protein [Verrucomicrobia bacterium]|nr:helix-turn-helix domain-containing protein [Cytophagales bacterium]